MEFASSFVTLVFGSVDCQPSHPGSTLTVEVNGKSIPALLNLLRDFPAEGFEWLHPGLRLTYPREWDLVFPYATFFRLVCLVAEKPDLFARPEEFRDRLGLCSPASILDIAALLGGDKLLTAVVSMQDPEMAARGVYHMLTRYGSSHPATVTVLQVVSAEYCVTASDLLRADESGQSTPPSRMSAIMNLLSSKQRDMEESWLEEDILPRGHTCVYCLDPVDLVPPMRDGNVGVRNGCCPHVAHTRCLVGDIAIFLGVCPTCHKEGDGVITTSQTPRESWD